MTYAALIIILYGVMMFLLPYIKIFFLIILPISIILLLISAVIYRKLLDKIKHHEERDDFDHSSDIRLSLLLTNHD